MTLPEGGGQSHQAWTALLPEPRARGRPRAVRFSPSCSQAQVKIIAKLAFPAIAVKVNGNDHPDFCTIGVPPHPEKHGGYLAADEVHGLIASWKMVGLFLAAAGTNVRHGTDGRDPLTQVCCNPGTFSFWFWLCVRRAQCVWVVIVGESANQVAAVFCAVELTFLGIRVPLFARWLASRSLDRRRFGVVEPRESWLSRASHRMAHPCCRPT